MACIGISESGNHLVFALKRALGALGYNDIGVRLADSSGTFDAVLIGNPPPKSRDRFTTNVLIVPDCMDASELSPLLASSVISYGLRRKNTVTASSLIGTRLVVSVQRDIPTVDGGTIGEQELIVTVNHSEHSDEILGIAAALLALGIPAEEISTLTFNI